MIDITWVNHASFIARTGKVALICDPWLEGSAFDHGWSLLSPTKFSYDDFSGITHIFFSHEHPDHFNPPNVRKIPQRFRADITVLFHQTRDKRVVNLCKAWGFQVRELPEDHWVQLGDDVAVLCGLQGRIDSWLALRANGQTVLNMNDCVFEHDSELRHISDRVPEPDVLFTQFSYANWVGNPGEYASHRLQAKRKLDEMARQVSILRCKVLVPCASFIWFSHAENYFANREANRIWDVHDFATRRFPCRTVVLYPGDQWRVGDAEHDSTAALDSYRRDHAAVENRPALTTSPPVTLEQLRQAHQAYQRKVLAKNNRYLAMAIRPAVVLITDLGLKVRISFLKGIEVIRDDAIADIATSSEALQYCYLWDWGGDTLAINGRYTVPNGGNAPRFFQNFRIPAYNATGTAFDLRLLAEIGARYLGRKLGVARTRPRNSVEGAS